MKEFHREDFANRTGLAQAWTVKSADRLFTHFSQEGSSPSKLSRVQDIQADVYPALTRMNAFKQAWSVFSQGYDNYVDEHCDLIVAHFWFSPDQHQ